MGTSRAASTLSRRRAIKLGAFLAAGIAAKASVASRAAVGEISQETAPSKTVQQAIEGIIEAQGKVSDGVLSIDIDRKDIQDVKLRGVPISSEFLLHGDLDFQTVTGSNAQIMMNADLCLKAGELDPFIRALIAHRIVFQAEHQHFYDFEPMVWFVHFRAQGDAKILAKGVKAALKVTSTPFPQQSPSNATTALPAQQIGQILGASPVLSGNGVVKYELARKEQMTLGGISINPHLNVATHVHFKPWGGGQNAAVAPDFGMTASEVNKVVGQQLQNGWDIGCLYNQETDEQPQLYWSHTFKTGDAILLAKELRQSFDLMNLKFR